MASYQRVSISYSSALGFCTLDYSAAPWLLAGANRHVTVTCHSPPHFGLLQYCMIHSYVNMNAPSHTWDLNVRSVLSGRQAAITVLKNAHDLK